MKILIAKGKNKLDIDGIYGKLTTTAVKSFQGLETIDVDGIFGS